MSNDLCLMPATELARKIRRRDISPVELVDAFLHRIDTYNPHLNAYVLVCHDSARKAAQEAERAVMSGNPLGPLHGLPIAIKDLAATKKGLRHTFGSKPFADFVPNQDAAFVENLERAGAIVLGKTNTPEFGHKGITDNRLFGPTRNPFDLSKNAGGSSGGAAAAVAAGLAAIAQGSDAGGSVRIPAAWCGVCGYKASYGRIAMVSRPNAFQSLIPFIHIGPLARTVADAALMLSAMTGPHPRDPLSLPDAPLDASVQPSVKGLKIAYSPALDVFPVESGVRTVIDRAVAAFEQAGASVEPVSLNIRRSQAELADLWVRQLSVIYAEFAATFKAQGIDLLGQYRSDLSPEFAEMIERGQRISAVEYRLDEHIRTEIFDAIQNVFETFDLLLSPTLAASPVPNADNGNTIGPSQINGEPVNPLIGWCLTYPVNYTGHPAASIPAGMDAHGMPVGLQIVGHRFADHTVLSACAAYECLHPWQNTYHRIRLA